MNDDVTEICLLIFRLMQKFVVECNFSMLSLLVKKSSIRNNNNTATTNDNSGPWNSLAHVYFCLALKGLEFLKLESIRKASQNEWLGAGVVRGGCTLRASLSGTFLQTLPDLVTPQKGHSLSPRSCPPTRSAPSESSAH